MKKLVFILLLCCITMGAWAQRVKLESGMLIFLYNEKHLDIKFTYDSLKVGRLPEAEYLDKKVDELNAKKPETGDKFRETWVNDRTKRIEAKFCEYFYREMKQKGITAGTDGTYTLIIDTYFIDPGINSPTSRKSAVVNATATFINNKTGGTAAKLQITNAIGANYEGADFDEPTYRIQEAYAKAGEALAKFLIAKSRW